MNIVFLGSDDFALTNFGRLINSSHRVVACVTQPDKAKGRGLKIGPPVIKSYAMDCKIPVFQPEDIKDPEFLKTLKAFRADLFVVVSFGKILPLEILNIPSVCCINVHPSLLPKYRGAAPINWAVLNGDKETGVSIIKMNAQMDAGEIFLQSKIKIEGEDTAFTLRAKLAQIGADALLKTIDLLGKRKYSLTVQDPHAVTMAPKLSKELGSIDWSKSAQQIHNLVRGLLPWPCAQTAFNEKMLKILQSAVVKESGSKPAPPVAGPGEIIAVNKDGFIVACGQQALLIKEVHPESSDAMDAQSFAAGQRLKAGDRMG